MDPGTKVDVGSSYHTEAEFGKCRIVHPLNIWRKESALWLVVYPQVKRYRATQPGTGELLRDNPVVSSHRLPL